MECVKDGRYNKLDFYEAIIIVNDLHNILLRKPVINQTFQKNMEPKKSWLDAFVQFWLSCLCLHFQKAIKKRFDAESWWGRFFQYNIDIKPYHCLIVQPCMILIKDDTIVHDDLIGLIIEHLQW